MILRSLLSRDPKWQSNDPAERAAAVVTLAPDAPELRELAASDPDASVRAAALARTNDLALLRARVGDETDGAARAAAMQRAVSLLADPAAATGDVPPEERLVGWPAEVLDRVVQATESTDVQQCAVSLLGDDAVLARIAESRLRPEVRLAAIDRVADREVLATLARSLKGHDKTLWRRAQTRLDDFREGERRETDAAALVSALETLAAAPIVAANQLSGIERGWDALGYSGPLAERFEAARAAARARLQEVSQSQQAAQRVLSALAELRARLPVDGAHGDALAAIEAELDGRRAEWDAIHAADLPKSVTGQYSERRIELEERLATLKSDAGFLARRDEALSRIVERVEQTDLAGARTLLAQWKQLPPPRPSPARTAQDERYATLRDRVATAAQAAAAVAAGAEEAAPHPLEQPLAALEAAMDEGAFGAARERHDALVDLIGRARAPGPELARRIDAARQRFAELAGWQRWGSAQAHEQLIADAEALANSPLPAPELARSVQALRERWKVLDKDQGAAPAALWHRFDKACTRAYEPARRHFAEEAKKRAERVAARERFCGEVALRGKQLIDGGAAPKDLQREIDHWRRQWRELGPVDRTKWKELDQLFDAALDIAKKPVDEAIEGSRARRKQLIEQAAALADVPVRQAVGTVKNLQQSWKTEAATVMLPRGEEQRLWESFRAACNAIFAKRDSEMQAAASKHQAIVAAKNAALDDVEKLAADKTAPERAARLQKALGELDTKWRDAGYAGRDEERRLGDRRARIEAAARGELSSLRRSRHFALFDVLAHRASLAAAAEALGGQTEAEREARLAELREQWASAAKLPPELEAPVKARFDAAAGTDAPTAEATPDERRELVLRAEILAGVDSPIDESRKRMAIRVEYLSRSVSGDSPNTLGEMQVVAARWHGLAGSAPPALQTRFDRALRAFQAKADTRAREPSRAR